MRVLYVVMARGGSKGVPRKNIREIGGLPLVAYKIISAKRSNVDKRIIVSTEDEEIAEICLRYGAEVPFKRPQYLAEDSADSMDVVKHAMGWIEENDNHKYDYVCMLEPSSPFASYIDFNNAFDILRSTDADTLLGMKEVDINSVFIHKLDNNNGLSEFYEAIKGVRDVRRQAQAKEYTMNGCMYIAKWDYFKKNKLFHSAKSVPYIMDEVSSIEIDSMLDYEKAKMYAECGYIDLCLWK